MPAATPLAAKIKPPGLSSSDNYDPYRKVTLSTDIRGQHRRNPRRSIPRSLPTSSATLECAAASMPLPAAADCDPDAAAPPCTPTDGEVKLYTGGCMPLPELPTTTRLAASLAFCTLGSVAAEGSENVYVGAAAASWAADAVATCVAVRSAALPASSATDALADWAAGCPKAGAPAAGRVMGLSGRVHAFSAGAGVVLGGALLVGAAASAERPTAGDATGLMKSRAAVENHRGTHLVRTGLT